MDTWILLRSLESNGERNRGIWVLKSRGMPHSNQIREFVLTDHGIELLDVYVGSGGVVIGTARTAQEAEEKAAALLRRQELELKQRNVERKTQALEAKIAALRAEFEAEKEEMERDILERKQREAVLEEDRTTVALSRQADARANNRPKAKGGSRNVHREIR
jgi:circadian clock protein KaiC